MLRVFLDESGTHDGSKVAAMAGFLVTPENWPLLEAAWLETLAKHGLSELHMKEFVPPGGKLCHWSEEQKKDLLEPLIGLIHKYSILGVGSAVIIEDYVESRAARGHEKIPDLFASPYGWCLRFCVAQVADWAQYSGHHCCPAPSLAIATGCETDLSRCRGVWVQPPVKSASE